MYSNIDVDSILQSFLNSAADAETFSEELLYPIVDLSCGTAVTDVLLAIFGQYSATDSQVFTDYADKFLEREYDGEAVDFFERYRGIYKLNKEYGVDPFRVWIRRCREIGIRPWLTIRMNDCHPDACLKSRFQLLARENGWLLGEKYGYFGNCLNYNVPEVRETMLRYIEEQLLRYDVHGIELDFMREIYCFRYLDEDMGVCTEIMNGFVRRVKAILSKAEAKFGHPIRLAVRLTRDIDQSLRFGFDARAWAKEDLVDMIVPSPRWGSPDSGIDFRPWKQALPGIEIPGCLETCLETEANGITLNTAETARGLAVARLAAGADGIYLFNFYAEHGVMANRDREVQKTAGTLEDIYRHPVRCVLRNQEFSVCPEPFSPWVPLPAKLNAGETAVFTLLTGTIPADKSVCLRLGLEKGSVSQLVFSLNEIPVTGFAPDELPEPKNAVATETGIYSAAVCVPQSDVSVISARCREGNVSICWMELDIR